jgi:alpha-L-rhamnosidase
MIMLLKMTKNRLVIIPFVFFIIFNVNIYGIEITELKCNFRNNPSGIDSIPGFSWILQSGERNQYQSAYHLLLSDDSLLLNNNTGNIWNTGKVKSEQSINVLYKGKNLESGKIYYWKLKVWDRDGEPSEWSNIARFITGLFDRTDWHGAQWIGYEEIPDSLVLVPGKEPWGKDVKNLAIQRATVPIFRKEFDAEKDIKSAYLFISGLGHYKAFVNGQQVSDGFLSPGWTDYRKTCLYNTYNITGYLLNGKNAIGVIAGNGFHNNNNERYKKLLVTYGAPRMICLVKITYKDGSRKNIVSGPDWKTSPSPVTYSSIYGGEDYDARLEQTHWDMPGFNDRKWQDALIVSDPGGTLLPEITCPVKVRETFTADKIIKLGSDTFLYDFGQNASGIIRIKVKGQKGQKIKFIPGELIDENMFVNQRASGRPYYFEYILRGGGNEIWQPQFTYYGFRYVQVEGAVPHNDNQNPEKPQIVELRFLHTFSSAPRVGTFNCSGELFNRINKLILYAIQSNLQSVLTDCPHREKLGWLEQTYLMGGSVHYNFDLYHLYKKLVDDMIDAQTGDGLIPNIAPEYVLFGGGFRDSPEWGSAGIILPWMVYKWYGDKSVLVKAWPMMQKYIDYLGSKADNHILLHGLGDWYDLGPGRPGFAQLTPRELTATAIYYYDVSLMASMASILNYAENEKRLVRLANEIKDAFNNKFFNADTRVYSTGSQTAMAMPLCVGLVNEDYREEVFNNLIDIINQNGKAPTAGDVGFHFLIEALSQGGASELIYEMNNRNDVPGYGYQLKKGATALTESWAALESVSNNHLMLGHIMEWFYKGLCGIRQEKESAAYKRIVIDPSIVGFTEAKAAYKSPFGIIRSEWNRTDSMLNMDVSIPVNTTARIFIPASDPENVFESGEKLKDVRDIKIAGTENGSLIIEAGSGNYRFSIRGQRPVRKRTGRCPPQLMQKIYEEIRTPYKYGLVLVPADSTKKTDCPTVFRRAGKWYMTYIVFDGRGYETWLAESNDLLSWKTLGRILSYTDSTTWDDNQKAGYPALRDYRWGKSYELEKYDNRYWMSYFGGSSKGYERGLLSAGIAYTDKDPATVHEWNRLDKPVLMATDNNARWWENNTIFKSSVIYDKSLATGYPFVMFYNARGDSLRPDRGAERIGMAVSADMVNWIRFGRDPVINHHKGISGDAVIQKIDEVWVIFYFGAFWAERKDAQAFNRFACSYDLVNWTDWEGPDLIAPSESYDNRFAHKSSLVKYKGVVYHFYCAVNKNDDRGIAVATSRNLGKSDLDFSLYNDDCKDNYQSTQGYEVDTF